MAKQKAAHADEEVGEEAREDVEEEVDAAEPLRREGGVEVQQQREPGRRQRLPQRRDACARVSQQCAYAERARRRTSDDDSVGDGDGHGGTERGVDKVGEMQCQKEAAQRLEAWHPPRRPHALVHFEDACPRPVRSAAEIMRPHVEEVTHAHKSARKRGEDMGHKERERKRQRAPSTRHSQGDNWRKEACSHGAIAIPRPSRKSRKIRDRRIRFALPPAQS